MTLCFGTIARDASPVGEDSAWLAQLAHADRVELIRGTESGEKNRYFVTEGTTFPTILCIALPEAARRWDLVPEKLIATAERINGYLVCAIGIEDTRKRFDRVGDVLGISPAVIRTTHALYEHCDVKAAAQAAGVTFHTAREHLSTARTIIGAANLSMLIMILNTSSNAIPNSGDESDRFIAELFGLTERQLGVASSIANGSTRRQCADAQGISEALVKKELAAIFDLLGVSNALALSRIFSDARSIAIITRYQPIPDTAPGPQRRVLTVIDAGGRRIVANDYGPDRGRPVLIFHSSLNSRTINRQLVAALQVQGFRPIAIDRPGFGDTDPVPGALAGKHDPFLNAARDVVTVCTHLEIGRIDIVTRGAAQVVVALQRLAPALVGKVVITNPDPDGAFSSKRDGLVGAFKYAFLRRPWAASAIGRLLAGLATYERVSDVIRRSVEPCPPDRIVMSDPDNMLDCYRAIEPIHKGRFEGFINEQVAMATLKDPPRVSGTHQWQLLIGEEDFIHNPAEAERYWKAILADATIRMVPGAGRFLTYSHAEAVAEALLR